MQENEGIREYMLPYKWAVGLGKIPGLPGGEKERDKQRSRGTGERDRKIGEKK